MKSIVFKDKIYLTGLIFIVISFTVFLIRLEFPTQSNFDFNGVFLVNYLLAVGYFVLLLVTKRLKKGRNGLPVLILLLVISLISCYSLNMDMNVFDDSSFWFCIVLIVLCLNFMTYGWFSYFPEWARILFFIIAGISFSVFVYLEHLSSPTLSFQHSRNITAGNFFAYLCAHALLYLYFGASFQGK